MIYINVGYDGCYGTGYQQRNNKGLFFKRAQVDCCDGCNDHNVIEQTGDTVHKHVVDIIFLNDVAFAEECQEFFCDNPAQSSKNKVEAP